MTGSGFEKRKRVAGVSGRTELSESDAIGAIDDALSALPDEASRGRVLEWAVAKFSPTRTLRHLDAGGRQSTDSGGSFVPPVGVGLHYALGPRATAWTKKHRLTEVEISSAFHVDGDNSSIIISKLPGKSKKEKLGQVAALLGALALLRSDQPKFTKAEFNKALEEYDALDPTNHSRYVQSHKSVVQGSGSNEFSVTANGLDLAVRLMREPSTGE